MPARKKPEREKLDFQVTFTLQHHMGERFKIQCGIERMTVQEKLRYLVKEYMEWITEKELPRPAEEV